MGPQERDRHHGAVPATTSSRNTGSPSVSSLSRYENGVGGHELYLASVALADLVIAHHRARLQGRARRITIDLDPTDDPTHGQQELSFFNGHYDTWCYLRLVATLTFNAEPRQYLVAAVLRPGNSPAKRGAIGLLTRLCRRLRAASRGSSSGSGWTGALRARGLGLLGRRGGRVRRGDGQQCAFGQTQPPLDGAGSDALQGQWRDRGPLWRDPLRRPEVAPQTADHHEGRGCAASRPGSQEQSSVRDHQPGRCPRGGLSGLSGAGRHGEPAQGAASRAGAGPDELPSVPRQPVPRAADRRGVHPVPDPASPRPGHGVCRRPGHHAARAAAQARGLGRALGAADRAASADELPLAAHLGQDRVAIPRPAAGGPRPWATRRTSRPAETRWRTRRRPRAPRSPRARAPPGPRP